MAMSRLTTNRKPIDSYCGDLYTDNNNNYYYHITTTKSTNEDNTTCLSSMIQSPMLCYSDLTFVLQKKLILISRFLLLMQIQATTTAILLQNLLIKILSYTFPY